MPQSIKQQPSPPHRAGEKIRAYRIARDLSAEELGRRIDPPRTIPAQSVYNWETRGKVARAPLQRRLRLLGICEPADWLEPATEDA
jgi:NAD+ synthase (glutamine-hydrolysing)